MEELGTNKEQDLSEEKIKEWLEVPAYLRRDIRLQPTASLPEQAIVRYQLDDDEGAAVQE